MNHESNAIIISIRHFINAEAVVALGVQKGASSAFFHFYIVVEIIDFDIICF
jgi:hypothetical protein